MRRLFLFGVTLVSVVCIYMWPVILKGQVAFPGDLSSRAYLPWSIEHKGPVHNPLLSDTFSQIFPWKKMVVEAYKQGRLPLWNPYTLSGTPLLANYHSGSLYPLNVLLFGSFLSGWNALLAVQFLIGGMGAYFLMRSWGKSALVSSAGALMYAFNTFGLLWWQVVHAGHTLAWIPWIFLTLSRYKGSRNKWYLFAAICLHFPLLTAGHFQLAVGALVIEVLYLLFNANRRLILVPIMGLGIAAIQLIPGMEMAKLSVRSEEKAVEKSNFGLISLDQAPRLVLPDFFGHPTTANYWGTDNYLESSPYLGLIPLVAIIIGVMNVNQLLREEKFWLVISVLFLLLSFDTPISRIIYLIKVPGLSTSGGSRLLGIAAASACLLIPQALVAMRNKPRHLLGVFITMVLSVLVGFTNVGFTDHLRQIVRTSAISFAMIGVLILSVLILRKKNLFVGIVIVLGLVDLFKFGWKFTTFSDRQEVFPDNQIISKLQQDTDLFRIEKIDENTFPANTWEWYGLYTVGGYEPMAYGNYVRGVHKNINGTINPTGSRYTMISKLDLPQLGGYSVKYLLVTDKETSEINLVNNPLFKHFFTIDGGTGEIQSVDYQGQTIKMVAKNSTPVEVTGRITNYPGWRLFVNKKDVPLNSDEKTFMKFKLPAGEAKVLLRYLPVSVALGAGISVFSILLSWYGIWHLGRGGRTQRTP